MEILTEHLRLREFQMEDWQAVLAYQRDPLYLQFYPWNKRNGQEVRNFIRMFTDQQAHIPRIKFQLAVTLRETGVLIGNVGIRMEMEGRSIADMGYEITPEHWGNGFATEAAGAMLRFGFEELSLHRIWAQCIADNVGSWRVMEKIGMKREGQFVRNEWFKDRWWNTLVYGILVEDWQQSALAQA